MKPLVLFVFISCAIQLFGVNQVLASDAGLVVNIGSKEFRLEEKGRDRLYLHETNKLFKTCHLDRPISEGMKASFDKKAIIVNAKRYLLVDDLLSCNDSKYVQEHKIPETVGWLTDINVQHKIYVAVDMEYSTPLGCIATVGRLPGKKNIISMPGTNVVGARKKNLNHIPCVEESFISPDGRYVAIEAIGCRDDLPITGVWDIKKNKKVVFSTEAFSENEIKAKCNALFDIENTKRL